MSRGSFTTPDGCRLIYDIAGSGPPMLWQHGLGAPIDQPWAVFPGDAQVTRITLACRGHDDSDLGPPDALSIPTFAGDVLALMDHLGIDRLAVAGGISMGAAISLWLAVHHPGRVDRLVLARPAWIDQPAPPGLDGYRAAGLYLRRHDSHEGHARFAASPLLRQIRSISPDNAQSLLGYFARPRPDTTIALLARLSDAAPGVTLDAITHVAQPALVIGHGEDPAHPLDYARHLARAIPGADLAVIPSKSVDPAGYTREFRAALSRFLVTAATQA